MMESSCLTSRKLPDHSRRQRRPAFWLRVAEASGHRHWEKRGSSASGGRQGSSMEEVRLCLSLQEGGVAQADLRPSIPHQEREPSRGAEVGMPLVRGVVRAFRSIVGEDSEHSMGPGHD